MTRNRNALLFATAAASVSLLPPTVASAATQTGGSTETYLGASSSNPLPAGTLTAADLNGMMQNGDLQLFDSSQAAPDTNTPDGYKLIHPGYRRSDYVYDSDYVYQGAYHCSGTCKLEAETRVQLHEYVVGTTSKYWELTPKASEWTNPGGYTWSYSASYYCGVNISGGTDHICGNGANASGGHLSVNTGTYKMFEDVDNNVVFPMVPISTIFSNGVTVTTKFRGWDVLNRSTTTKLNTSSGNGN